MLPVLLEVLLMHLPFYEHIDDQDACVCIEHLSFLSRSKPQPRTKMESESLPEPFYLKLHGSGVSYC